MRIPGNFDRWMFNYKEGNLSAEEAAYFESYLLSNPNYASDADAWENAYVRQENIEYPHVNALLKDKSFFANWRNLAAILLLLITVGSGIGIANRYLAKDTAKYSLRSEQTIQLTDTDQYRSIYQRNSNTAFDALGSQLFSNNSDNDFSNSENEAASYLNGAGNDNQSNSKLNVADADGNFANGANDNDFSYQYQNYKGKFKNKNAKANRKIESYKINGKNGNYAGTYYMNPNFDVTVKEISFKKNKTSYIAYQVKRLLRKIDKITGYPVAIVNLRDPDLLVPNKNILNFNPGFAGSGGNFRIGADYRNQWMGESVNSQLSTLYFDTYSSAARGGIGASITYGNYKGGLYQNMTANLYYSPKFVINKHIVFEPALKVTMGRGERNITSVNTASAIELNRGNVISQNGISTAISNNSWYKDYGIGFVLNTDWFYVGGFVDNIAGHDQRIYSPGANLVIESSKLYTAVIGFDYQSRNKRTTLSPFLTYSQFGAKKEAWAGATAQFNWLTIGASYSSNREYAASVGLKFKSFKLSYQLDMTESEFLQENFVSHNIGIRFNTKNKTIR